MKPRHNKIIIGILTLLLIGFIIIIMARSGFFRKDPEVEIQPENHYDRTLTVITDEDYRPYSFYGKKYEYSGHDVELINIIANELHMNLNLRFMNWYDAIDAVTNGEADVLMTCDFSDSFAGVEKLVKSEPVSFDDFIIYSKTKIASSDEIYGKRIGIMRNGNVTSQIKMMNVEHFCVEYENNREAMQALMNDEVDVAIMRQTVATVLISELGAKGIKGYVSIGQSFMCFGIRADRGEIADKINQTIESLKINGEMERLRQKWLTTFVKPYTISEILFNNIWLILLFLALVAIAVTSMAIGISRRRRNEIQEYQNAQVVERLAQDFSCVNYVVLTGKEQTDRVINYRVSEELKAKIPGWENEKFFLHKMILLRDYLVYEPDREEFYENSRREKVLEALQDQDSYLINTRIMHDGEIQYYQMKFSPVRENGKIRGIVAGLHSVDEETKKEMQYQEQLEDALTMANQANLAKTTFLNNMSHDIRTPMNAIIGYNELAEKHLDDPQRVKDYLGKIGQSSEHLLRLINDVLDMSRIESGRANLEEKAESLYDIVQELRDIVQASVQEKHHDFSVNLKDITDDYIICDRLRLNQVLLNILSNAVKYTPDGGRITMTVSETARKESGYATYGFVIEDNGIGMDEEYLKKLFEPFTRVKSSTVSGIQGTGLGMAITKNLVEMMGGEILVESEPEKGTVMTVIFSFLTAKPDTMGDSDLQQATVHDFAGKKVLLVEDNEMNREIATEILEENGFLVDTAEDGDIAVERVRNAVAGDFDIILMDVQMPRMNGYEATKAIRALGTEISKIPILAMTANAFEEDRKAALAAGMDEHIAKPIDIPKLLAALTRFL